jgi:D-alanine-D-alanine ligase
LIDVTDGDYMRKKFQPRSWEWIDKRYFVCRERSLSKNRERLISREVITHVRKGVIADQFYAERLYTQTSLKNLFNQADYSEIAFHTEMITDSKRNQNLGMMERRIIIAGRAEKEWTPVKRTVKGSKTIFVILGDPRKIDRVKPEANFDRTVPDGKGYQCRYYWKSPRILYRSPRYCRRLFRTASRLAPDLWL